MVGIAAVVAFTDAFAAIGACERGSKFAFRKLDSDAPNPHSERAITDRTPF
jgi:hypothetical protein